MGKLSKEEEKRYEEYVKKITPTTSLIKNMFFAFVFGGLICTIGQFILNILTDMGLEEKTANMYQMVILVGTSALFTGLSWYAKLAKWGGAGTMVPITGFANSVAASAMEFRPEGQVFGVGCRIFQIAGPVILYGIFTSWLIGLIYWIFKVF